MSRPFIHYIPAYHWSRLAAVFCAAFLLFLIRPALAIEYSVQTVPNVQAQSAGNFVSNPDGLITREDVAAINAQALELRKLTGIEVALVAVKSIGGNEPRMFATDLFSYWKLGQQGKDNGLLILLVTEPPNSSVVFETGYGLEGIMPDAIAFRLQQNYMIPDLKQGDYSQAMRKGMDAVSAYIKANPDVRQNMLTPQAAEQGEETTPFQSLGAIIGFILLFFLFRRNPAFLGFILGMFMGGGGGSMSRF